MVELVALEFGSSVPFAGEPRNLDPPHQDAATFWLGAPRLTHQHLLRSIQSTAVSFKSGEAMGRDFLFAV